jgi:hypothetical protein
MFGDEPKVETGHGKPQRPILKQDMLGKDVIPALLQASLDICSLQETFDNEYSRQTYKGSEQKVIHGRLPQDRGDYGLGSKQGWVEMIV